MRFSVAMNFAKVGTSFLKSSRNTEPFGRVLHCVGMHDPSKLFAPAVRFLSLALLSYLPACSASETSPASEQRGNDALESVGASRAELSVDLTTTIASAIDQRNTLDGEWPVTKVYDNDLSTKMFFHHEDNWIRYQLAGPSVVTRYEVSRSLDNYPDRVPTAWTLEASHDGIVWVELDSQSGETLPVGTPGSYVVTNSTAYLYYRLYVRDNHTDANGDTELAEFRIFGDAPSGTVPAAPTNVTASVNSNAITVSWSAATNAQSYIVARIGDDGASVIEQTTSALSYTDTNLAPGTTYVYQIQALNGGRRGPVSTSRAVATTAFAARGLKDITALIATAPSDEHATNSGPESVAMVTDNNPYTKWYQGDGSTWIVQQAEYDAMFGDKEFAICDSSSYDKLKDAKRITLDNADHDVFGDGTVIVKTAPGHTPGHQMLFLRLKNFGPLLLEGDLYHLSEERTLDRVPTFDFDGAMTRATRVRTEAFLKETGAQMWIQHDPPTNAKLRKAPEFYD